MIKRKSKVMAFSVPQALYEEVVLMAKEHNKTQSELFRDMVSIYRRFQALREEEETRILRQIVDNAQVMANTVPYDEEMEWKEFKALQRYGREKAKKLGLNTEDEIEQYINERREAKSRL